MRENKILVLEERCKQILEKNGGKIANLSNRILLQDQNLKSLKPPLEFIAKSWRDPVTPAMMALACKVAGGKPEWTENYALSLSLMNLSFYIWDDVLDKTPHKKLKPTLYGKYGSDIALIVGGLAAAKAFTVLGQNQIESKKKETIANMLWNLWAKMAKTESINLRQRETKCLTSQKILWKIKTEAAADLRTCLEIGAIVGNASNAETKHLGKYGQNLAIINELWKDFMVTTNLTLELTQKIQTGAYPYTLLKAIEDSCKIENSICKVSNGEGNWQIAIKEVVAKVLETNAIKDLSSLIEKFSELGKKELEGLKRTEASQTLKEYLVAETQLFLETMPKFT